MNDFFKELFAYSHHYNQKLAEIFTAKPENTSEKSVKLFCHILNAHHIWNYRINMQPPLYAVWGMLTPEEFAAIDKDNYEQSLKILDVVDLDKKIDYKTSAGQPFTNSVKDILFHVVNHSTYHRAQIATEFKNNGIDPLISDYIFYKR